MPVAAARIEAHPARMADRGRRRRRGDPVHLPLPAHGLGAELLDARQRPRPLPDGQDDEHAQRSTGSATSCRTTARRSPCSPTRRPPARVALAGAGLLGNTQPGFALFDKQNLGESNFQQQVTYQRALQGQLDETINSVQGVSGAQVELVLPKLPEPGLRRKPGRLLGRRAAVGHQLARPGLGARDRPARRLERARPAAEQSHDHRRHRPAALAAVLGRRGGVGQRACRKPSSATTRATAASLDAMLAQTLGAGQGAGARLREHERQPDDQGIARLRQDRRAAAAEQVARDADRQRRAARAARPAPRTSPRPAAAGGKSNYKNETTTSSLGVEQDRHPLDDRARRRRKPARLGAARPLRARRLAAGDPRSDHERRGHPGQARRHDLDRPGRLRQARRRGRRSRERR